MARRRDYRAEAARRNELARKAGYGSYYEQRVARARKASPNISLRAARGHANPEEKKLAALLKLIRSEPKDVQVSFVSKGRHPDGTYRTGWFDVTYINGAGEPQTDIFEIDADVLHPRMDEVADAISTHIGQGFLGWGSP